MRAAFRQANPDVAFVDGLAPITPLLVAQFEQALDHRPEQDRRLSDLRVAEGWVEFRLRADARVRLIAYRLTRLYRTRAEQLLDDRLPPGLHHVELKPRLARAKEAFIVARADDGEVHFVPVRA